MADETVPEPEPEPMPEVPEMDPPVMVGLTRVTFSKRSMRCEGAKVWVDTTEDDGVPEYGIDCVRDEYTSISPRNVFSSCSRRALNSVGEMPEYVMDLVISWMTGVRSTMRSTVRVCVVSDEDEEVATVLGATGGTEAYGTGGESSPNKRSHARWTREKNDDGGTKFGVVDFIPDCVTCEKLSSTAASDDTPEAPEPNAIADAARVIASKKLIALRRSGLTVLP